ncbi:hypothetical protein SNE26_23855 [Mucilaginibacter sp. cycad4]|uniref:hypothetical protein n=1 Tax=Mucilaginibacter sp. cycad4 TaxID=3342096 RepID=UPI002AAC2D7D|nr:hypothetical protein [Mucilaginibacter gossypii]WPU99051.1 hypothetical protein SNE26_23855 [Mucilaginibacter gossypii]
MKKLLFLLLAVQLLSACQKNIIAPANSAGTKLTKTITTSTLAARVDIVPLKLDSLSGIKIVREYVPFTNIGANDKSIKPTLSVATSNGLFKTTSKFRNATDH